MAAITISGTPLHSANAVLHYGVAGVAIAAGQTVYIDTANSNVLKLCDSNASLLASTFAGFATNTAAIGQTVEYTDRDPNYGIGATVAIGDTFWTSPTAGGVTSTAADNVSGCYVTSLGTANSTTTFNLNPSAAGAVKA